ncbi:hypothetical protein ES705_32960 [subsurface metagenome]
MKLYLSIKKMTFEEDDIDHNIINGMLDKEFLGYDEIVELPDDDKFIKDTLRIIYKKDKEDKDTDEIEGRVFDIREKRTWCGFPLYELKNGEIVPFDYTRYAYFAGTKRRVKLGEKIGNLYNMFSESKIQRKTLKHIMNTLNIEYPDFFRKYDNKIEEVINKNPKGNKNK